MLYDCFGIYGYVLHYSLILFLVGSAFFIFSYLWYKGRLDMDEEPAIEMLKASEKFPWKHDD